MADSNKYRMSEKGERERDIMKRRKLILYYAIVFAVIICGFFVGSKEKIENHGYRYYGEMQTYPLQGRKSEYLGDFTKTKVLGWYFIPLKVSNKYYVGVDKDNPIAELDYDFIKKNLPISEVKYLSKDDFRYIYYGYLLCFVVICSILICFPFGLSFIAKFHKKKTGKRNIKKIKELADMKELGIISEEEFETKKKQLLGL